MTTQQEATALLATRDLRYYGIVAWDPRVREEAPRQLRLEGDPLMNELDRHKLAETRDWQLARYRQAVRQTVSVLVDAIQRDTKQALEREITYPADGDMRNEYNYADQAAEIQHLIIQAVNNADFRGLLNTAADLHATEVAARALAGLKETLPEEVAAALTEREDAGLQGRLDGKLAEIEAREQRDGVTCQAAVYAGVGVHRCSKKGRQTRTVDGRPGYLGEIVEPGSEHAIEVLVCNAHAKDTRRLSIYRPNEWEANESQKYRVREQREIARMRSRLSLAVEAAPTRKELEQ